VNKAAKDWAAVLAEGLALAEACGIEPAAALNVLQATPAYSRVMETKGPKMIAHDYTPQARLAQHRPGGDGRGAAGGRLLVLR
jgi:3-hydroxyisobutyrate dehydrogenase-like beta-hydroxyacid dehydrogenase